MYATSNDSTGSRAPPSNPHAIGISRTFLSCYHDGASATACDMEEYGCAGVVSNGEWLWELPEDQSGRIAPDVTTAWHGMVYGTTENGPVVIDARNGADVETDPGVAPFLVNEYVGLVLTDGAVHAHPPVA